MYKFINPVNGRKLNSQKGETLVETLVAILIIAVGFIMLSGAIVAAARVNASVKNTEVVFNMAGQSSDETEASIVHGSGAGGQSTSVTVTKHKTENEYVYYSVPKN